MVTKLQDANIVIEIDEGRAKAELERFRQLLSQQGATFDREREGEQKKEAGKAKREMQKEKQGAIKSLSAVGQGITNTIRSIKSASLEALIATPLTLLMGAGAAPAARAIAKGGIAALEFGPDVAAGFVKGSVADKLSPATMRRLDDVLEKMKRMSSEIISAKAAIQALGQTTDQVSKIGISMAKGGEALAPLIADKNFASKMMMGIYDYNKAQIGAQRHAYVTGMGYFSEAFGTIAGRVFDQ